MTIILLALAMLRQGRAAETTVTITGVLTGGWDQLGIFATGKEAQNMSGKPFTLVFTFDDAKGKPLTNGNCVQGVAGEGTQSPGRAMLTMGNGSFTFGGAEKFSTSSIGRDCAGMFFGMFVSEKKGSFFNTSPAVDVRVIPGNGNRQLPLAHDWRAPFSSTGVDNSSSCFIIVRADRPNKEVKGCFDVKKVESAGPKSWWQR
jgi:hypothetical protein